VVAEIFHSRWFGKDIPLGTHIISFCLYLTKEISTLITFDTEGRAEIKMIDLTSKAEVREIANVSLFIDHLYICLTF